VDEPGHCSRSVVASVVASDSCKWLLFKRVGLRYQPEPLTPSPLLFFASLYRYCRVIATHAAVRSFTVQTCTFQETWWCYEATLTLSVAFALLFSCGSEAEADLSSGPPIFMASSAILCQCLRTRQWNQIHGDAH
jgi:hypothetical protein